MLNLFSYVLFVSLAWANTPSPLCENLSRFACAPGSYNDGTGVVKSGPEIEEELAKLRIKHKERSQKLAAEALQNPDNEYFKDKAIAAMGLKNSPDCNSKDQSRKAECDKKVIDGLAELLQKKTGNSIYSRSNLKNRYGNMKDLGFLVNDVKFKALAEKAENELSKDVSDPKLESRIKEKIFPQIRDLIADRLKSLPIKDEHKKFMISKIKAIEYQGTNCTELSESSSQIDGLFVPNAFYQSSADFFKYCHGKLIQGTSEFTIAAVIAHELSHSIDPCNITQSPRDTGVHYSENSNELKSRAEYPVPNIISCLRSPKSIGAKTGLQPQMMMGMGNGQVMAPPPNGVPPGGFMPQMQPNPNQDIPAFCQGGDQIGEAFSDWMAAEVTPHYIEKNHKLTPEQYQIGYSNIRRPNCLTGYSGHSEVHSGQDPHSDDDSRIDKIILVQPKIREQMKCPKNHSSNIYCDPTQPFAATPTNGTMNPGFLMPQQGLPGQPQQNRNSKGVH